MLFLQMKTYKDNILRPMSLAARAAHKSTVEVKTNCFVKSVFIKQNISSGKIDYKIIVTSNNLATKMITI